MISSTNSAIILNVEITIIVGARLKKHTLIWSREIAAQCPEKLDQNYWDQIITSRNLLLPI